VEDDNPAAPHSGEKILVFLRRGGARSARHAFAITLKDGLCAGQPMAPRVTAIHPAKTAAADLPEPIDDPRLVQIVRRHLDLHPVTESESDETLAHFARDVGEHLMLVCEGDAKHRAREHSGDGSVGFDDFFNWHNNGSGRLAAPGGPERVDDGAGTDLTGVALLSEKLSATAKAPGEGRRHSRISATMQGF